MESVQAATASAAAASMSARAPSRAQEAQPAGSAATERVVVAATQVNQQITETRQAQKSEPKFDPSEMRQRLQEAVDRLNDQMKATGRNLAFGIDEQVDRSVITVTNKNSGELVRQIPGDEVLRVARSIEGLKGILYDEFL